MVSTKGRYALRFLLDLAEHQAEGYVPLKDVAGRQEISEKYLEIVVKELVKGGFCLKPGQAPCPRKDRCRTLPLWQGLDQVISDYLEPITLADLIVGK